MALLMPSEEAPEQHDPAQDLPPANFRTLEDVELFCQHMRQLGHRDGTVVMVRNASGYMRQITGFGYNEGFIQTGHE